MWLKKKFVVSTNWCITLDRIPRSFYSEIVQNKAQVQEWISLYAIDLLDGFSEELSEEFLVRNQNLIVDTVHFPSDFTGRLMASFENLEENTDGLLVHSDNFQALNLLKERYQNSVSALYADPPYNTNASEILYKNGYKHSSWISLINDRALAAKKLLTEKAIACYTIDDLELNSLSILLDGIFGPDNKLANVLIRNNPSGRSTVKGFSINHEYALFYANSSKAQLGRLPHNDAQKNRYDLKDEHGYYEWENFRKNGTDSDRADRPRQFFPIAVENTCHTLLIPSMEWNEAENQWDIKETIPDSYTVVYPYSGGIAKVWKYGIERTGKSRRSFLSKKRRRL